MKRLLIVGIIIGIGAAAAFGLVQDPTRLGVGARSISLGRCSAALFNDPNSAFINPASAALMHAPGVSTMYVGYDKEITYTQLGIVIPREGEAVAFTFLGATAFDGSSITAEAGRTYPSGFTADHASSFFSLAYARRLNDKLLVGAALKRYSNSFVPSAAGNGYDLDLGLLWKPNKELSVGLVQQNTLPASIARMQWDTGLSEGIPFNTKLGVSLKGEDMLVTTDLDYARNQPLLAHGGIESGTPWKFLTVRGGFDQYAVDRDTVATNLTVGLGIKIGGLGVDYAYYNDTKVEDVAHSFSLRYQPPLPEKVKAVKQPEVKKAEAVPQPKPKIELKSFPDVPEDYFAHEAISYLATVDIISGYPDGGFRPETPLTRAQMAKLLVTVSDLKVDEKVKKTGFPDLAPTHWSAPYVARAAEHGWLSGYLDKTFRPERVLSRAEGVALLATFDKLKVPKQVTRNTYADVPTAYWAARAILGAKQAGWLDYIETGEFKPKSGFLRAEAVYLLYRTTAGQKAVRKLKP